MKKILIAAAALIFAAGSLSAQDYQKNIFGAKVGLNITGMTLKSGNVKVDAKARAGVSFAGTYQRLLTENLPLYLETGLEFAMAGTSYGDKTDKTIYNLWYMDIPVMVNYKFFVGDFTIYPSVGLYYALGLGGNLKYKWEYEGEKGSEKYKVFGKYDPETREGGVLTRSDLGIRVGVTGQWQNFTVGLAYSNGFLNIANTSDDGWYDKDTKFHNWGFNISVGYNF